MKQSRFSLSCGVWLLALLMVNPSLQAAKKKRAVSKKEPAKAVVLMKDEHLRDKIDQEIADLRETFSQLGPHIQCVGHRLPQHALRQHLLYQRQAGLANVAQPFFRALLALLRTFLHGEATPACVAVDQKQCVHARDHSDRRRVPRIHLHRVDELAPCVRPTADAHQLGPTDVVIRLVTVGLQNPFPLSEKLAWPLAPAP